MLPFCVTVLAASNIIVACHGLWSTPDNDKSVVIIQNMTTNGNINQMMSFFNVQSFCFRAITLSHFLLCYKFSEEFCKLTPIIPLMSVMVAGVQ